MFSCETRSEDVECNGVLATGAEWQMVRAATVDVASRAAYLGYASDRFGSWEVSAQRQDIGPWPPGLAVVRLMLTHRHNVLRRWLADLPMLGAVS